MSTRPGPGLPDERGLRVWAREALEDGAPGRRLYASILGWAVICYLDGEPVTQEDKDERDAAEAAYRATDEGRHCRPMPAVEPTPVRDDADAAVERYCERMHDAYEAAAQSPAAVERAARALAEARGYTWVALSEDGRDVFRSFARAALAAAWGTT